MTRGNSDQDDGNQRACRHIAAEIRRQLLVEAGHRCAITTCRVVSPLEAHHITPWSERKTHDPKEMIILCSNCHGRAHKGEIDKKSLRRYKQQLCEGGTSSEQVEQSESGAVRADEDLIDHGGVLWEEVGVIDLHNPSKRRGADGPFCPDDYTRLGYEDTVMKNRRFRLADSDFIGGVFGRLYCPACDRTFTFPSASGMNLVIGKSFGDAKSEVESILAARRRRVRSLPASPSERKNPLS